MSKGLEALEKLKGTLLAEGYWQDVLQDCAIIEKELKALEIIKEAVLPCERPYGEQFDYVDFGDDYLCIDGTIWLSKEKIELLKKVLL